MLLREPAVRDRLYELATLRPTGHPSIWRPGDGLAYYLSLDRLYADLDGTWSGAELGDLIDLVADPHFEPGERGVGIGFAAGRVGRGRAMTEDSIAIVARALALRAAGLAASTADSQAADERNKGRPIHDWITAEAIAVYRKRLRDRLSFGTRAELIEANITLTLRTGRRLDGAHPSPGAWHRGCRCEDCLAADSDGGWPE